MGNFLLALFGGHLFGGQPKPQCTTQDIAACEDTPPKPTPTPTPTPLPPRETQFTLAQADSDPSPSPSQSPSQSLDLDKENRPLLAGGGGSFQPFYGLAPGEVPFESDGSLADKPPSDSHVQEILGCNSFLTKGPVQFQHSTPEKPEKRKSYVLQNPLTQEPETYDERVQRVKRRMMKRLRAGRFDAVDIEHDADDDDDDKSSNSIAAAAIPIDVMDSLDSDSTATTSDQAGPKTPSELHRNDDDDDDCEVVHMAGSFKSLGRGWETCSQKLDDQDTMSFLNWPVKEHTAAEKWLCQATMSRPTCGIPSFFIRATSSHNKIPADCP